MDFRLDKGGESLREEDPCCPDKTAHSIKLSLEEIKGNEEDPDHCKYYYPGSHAADGLRPGCHPYPTRRANQSTRSHQGPGDGSPNSCTHSCPNRQTHRQTHGHAWNGGRSTRKSTTEAAQRAMAKEFEKTHPNIKVNVTVLPESGFTEKMTTTLGAGAGAPDVGYFWDTNWFPQALELKPYIDKDQVRHQAVHPQHVGYPCLVWR